MELPKEQINYPIRVMMTRQKFSVLEKRIFLRAFSYVKTGFNVQQDLFDETVEVTLKYSDFENENWSEIKTSLKKLAGRLVEVVDNDREYDALPWLSRARATRNEGIVIRFNKDINSMLMELSKGYAKLEVNLMLTLNSEYSQRLYEFLSHWYDVGRKEPFELSYIRDLLNVPTSYNLSKIKKQILEHAKTELADKTNIQFEYELIKLRSSSFNYVKFYIKKTNVSSFNNAQTMVDFDTLGEKSQRCYDRARGYGINNEVDLKIIVDQKQKEFWQLHAKYQTEENKPSAGKVLIDLGIRESKF